MPTVPPGEDPAAAWPGDIGHADPRIGRPNRTGVLVALGALLVAGLAVLPVVTGVVAVCWMLVARTADRSVTSLVLRRHGSGVRRSDVPVAVVSGPWHVVVAAVATLLSAIVPALVGVSAAFCTALVVSAGTGADSEPLSAIPLGVGGLLGLWVAWWGPGGTGLRRGTRSIVRGATRLPGPRRVVVALALVAALGLVLWCLVHGGDPSWWPRRGVPDLPTPRL